MATLTSTPLLAIDSLYKSFQLRSGIWSRQRQRIHALRGISLNIKSGETLGLVGESGCGKSTLGRTIIRLVEPDSGTILWAGENLAEVTPIRLRQLRREIQMIFQDPYASLNPRMKVADILSEPFYIHKESGSYSEKARTLLDLVGLPTSAAEKYPHEFSGGQRQRIGIARALALGPKMIIADEPVSALDVSVQAQILNLLQDLKSRLGHAMLFISHDLSVVEFISDRVAVMYLGSIVEIALTRDLYAAPFHPYTQLLLAAIPQSQASTRQSLPAIAVDPPSPLNLEQGCAFSPRCPLATKLCQQSKPKLREVPGLERLVACHHVQTKEA